MRRMPAEKRRHQGAAPDRSRHFLQEQEKQRHVGAVQKDVGQMMKARLDAEKLDIQEMRNPRHGMPVAGRAGLEGPGQTVAVEARPHIRIFRHVGLVVETDKIVLTQRREQRQGDGGEGQGNPPPARLVVVLLHLSTAVRREGCALHRGPVGSFR